MASQFASIYDIPDSTFFQLMDEMIRNLVKLFRIHRKLFLQVMDLVHQGLCLAVRLQRSWALLESNLSPPLGHWPLSLCASVSSSPRERGAIKAMCSS